MSDLLLAAEGEGFTPPGPRDFEPTPFFTVAGWQVDKIVLVVALSTALIVWVIYNYLGIKRAGLVGYFRDMMFPPGIPKPVYLLLAPIEFISTILVRPVTLVLRLTLNMFAGHLVLVLFVLGGEYLLLEYGGLVGVLAGTVSILGSIVVTFFEAFIQLLQAYVFTLLAALYIGGALVDEH